MTVMRLGRDDAWSVLADVLRALREDAGWSQPKTVRELNRCQGRGNEKGQKKPFGRSTLAEWEGRVSVPPPEAMEAYETVFKLETGYLLRLRRLAEAAKRGVDPRAIRDGVTDDQLTRFKDHDLAAYRHDLDVRRDSKAVAPLGPLSDERYDALVDLVVDHGLKVGRCVTAQTQRIIADCHRVLQAIELAFERADLRAVPALAGMAGCAFLQGVTLERFEARSVARATPGAQLADVYNALGLSAAGASRLAYAEQCFRAAANVASCGIERWATAELGLLEVWMRLHDVDVQRAETLRAVFAGLHDPVGVAHCDLLLAEWALRRGAGDEAGRRLAAAAAGYKRRDRLGELNCAKGFADIAEMRGRHDDARKRYTTASKGYEALGFVLGRAHCLLAIANLDLMGGRVTQARKGIAAATKLYAQIANALGMAKCLLAAAEIDRRCGKPRRARGKLERAQWLCGTVQYGSGVSLCASRLGDLAASVALGTDTHDLTLGDHRMPDDNG